MSIVVGMDIGTSGTKGVAIDADGQVLASALVEYPLITPRPDWAEQDPADWETAAFEALGKIAQQLGPRAGDVQGMGLTGQMHGCTMLDAHGKVLRNALLWCDSRTTPQCEAITEAAGGEDQLMAMTCNPALVSFTATKLLWVRDNEPEVYAKCKQVLMPKDYVRYCLTGAYATDVAEASGTLVFDVQNREWHTGLMGLLDIDPALWPQAFEGPEVTGTLTKAAAEKTGLPEGIPVIAGGGDQAAGGIGCGVVERGIISSTMGTSGVVFAFAPEPVIEEGWGSTQAFCHSVPQKWFAMGVVMSAGGSLRWYRDALCRSEKAVAADMGRDAYELITAQAESAPIGAEGLAFLPYLTGERCPHKDPFAKGAFVGFSLRHTKAHMARAVLEGVSFAMRDTLEVLKKIGVPIEQVRASGGGAKSPFWRQMQADINGLPMTTINVDEGPSFGSAILAMVPTGMHASVEAACRHIIKVTDQCDPNPENSKRYEESFREYQELYKALKPSFARTAKRLSADG